MSTHFTISHEGKVYELNAEKVNSNETIEVWRVYSRADRNAFLELSNDRPLLHSKHQYKQRFKWTVLEGSILYRKMVSQIASQLDYHIKGLWKPPTKGIREAKEKALKAQGKLF